MRDGEQVENELVYEALLDPMTKVVRAGNRSLLMTKEGIFIGVLFFPDGTVDEAFQLSEPEKNWGKDVMADIKGIADLLNRANQTIVQELARLHKEVAWSVELEAKLQKLKTSIARVR